MSPLCCRFRIAGALSIATVALAATVVRAESPPESSAPATVLNPSLPTIFIAGDSTAASTNGDRTQGWGAPLAGHFDGAKVNVANRARGGRSSRTFVTDGHWDRLLAELKAGD